MPTRAAVAEHYLPARRARAAHQADVSIEPRLTAVRALRPSHLEGLHVVEHVDIG